MDLTNWGKLLVKIENKRRKLYELYTLEPNNPKKLLQASQQLDELINQYQQEVKTFIQ